MTSQAPTRPFGPDGLRDGPGPTSPRAFQDQIGGNHCWGCGPDNERGLRIKSYWVGDESICTVRPERWHAAGPPSVLNGGIIATILDCHAICTAIAAAYRAEGRPITSDPPIWYATGSLEMRYLRPAPLGAVLGRARIEETTPRKTVLSCSLVAGDEVCATAKVVAVRVPPAWPARLGMAAL